MVAERLNGLRVTIEALNDAGERIGNPEIYAWTAEQLAKFNEPLRVVGKVTGLGCLEALYKRLVVLPND